MNPTVRPLPPPGPWVTRERCDCGARYADHRGDYSFLQAVHRLRGIAKDEGDSGGGWRSRRAVLWVLRCMKLDDWYMEHAFCGGAK